MNEEPKNIWKKSFRPPGLLLAWLLLMAITMGIFLVVSFSMNPPFVRAGNLPGLLIFGAASATVLLGLWLFIRWLCCWKNFRRFLFGLASAVTLIALFYGEQNWRGKRDWENFKQEWSAKGEKFDFNDFIPAAVQDQENVAMAPIFDATDKLASRKWRNEHRNQHQNANGSSWDPPLVDRLEISLGPEPWPTNGLGDWHRALTSDLQSWQSYYHLLATRTNTYPISLQPQSSSQDVLLALSVYQPVIEDLAQAVRRPACRFPLDYDDEDPAEILLPHLATLKRCSQILQLRALAELEADQPTKALDDIKLSLRLAETVRTEPFIITHLVRLAILQPTLQPVWEGLARHKWSDAQLVELDASLTKLDFLADYQLSIRGERAADIKIVDWLEQKRSRYQDLFNVVDGETRNGMNNFGRTAEAHLMPRGWYYRSEMVIAQMQQQWNLPGVDDARQTVSPEFFAEAQHALDTSLPPTAINIFPRLLLPALGNYGKKIAAGQNAVSLARTAIALERYHLARGAYPETLAPLAPQFITEVPHDVIGGQPLKYRHEANGQFVLYSIGWNEKDEDGLVALKEKGESAVDIDQGDWVWKYPAR